MWYFEHSNSLGKQNWLIKVLICSQNGRGEGSLNKVSIVVLIRDNKVTCFECHYGNLSNKMFTGSVSQKCSRGKDQRVSLKYLSKAKWKKVQSLPIVGAFLYLWWKSFETKTTIKNMEDLLNYHEQILHSPSLNFRIHYKWHAIISFIQVLTFPCKWLCEILLLIYIGNRGCHWLIITCPSPLRVWASP